MADLMLPLAQLDPRICKLLGHPLRWAIYMKLGERPWSATELEGPLETPAKRISEQLGIMFKEGAIEPIAPEPGPNGGLLHKYRSGRSYFTAEDWAQIPLIDRENINVTISQVFFKEVIDALQGGSFESHPSHVLLRVPLPVDDQGVKDIESIMVRAKEEVEEVGRESLGRSQASSEPMVPLITAFWSFPAAPPDSSSGPDFCPS